MTVNKRQEGGIMRKFSTVFIEIVKSIFTLFLK